MLYPLSYVSFHWRPDSNRRPLDPMELAPAPRRKPFKIETHPQHLPRKLKPSGVRNRE